MSILLESLSRNAQTDASAVPNLDVNHFDDDMLGDDWLLQKIRRWRLATFLLVVLLVGSWGFFLWHWSDAPTSTTQLNLPQSPMPQPAISATTPVVQSTPVLASAMPSNELPIESANSMPALENAKNDARQNYQPKLRETEITAPINEVVSNQRTQNKSVSAPSKIANNAPLVTVEELPDSLRTNFPAIALGSYVVSENPTESFIILDGVFYKINQVIAPHTILREIAQEYIVVEYYDYRVKLPTNG